MTEIHSNQIEIGVGTSEASSEPISTRVVDAVADVRGVDPLDLDVRLFDVVDPDALDSLFEPSPFSTERSRGQVSFTMAGCEVVVDADGSVSATWLEA